MGWEGSVSDRWFAKAAREPGHPLAHGYPGITEPQEKRGLVYHDAGGNLATLRRISQAPGEPSFTFINPKRGRLIQCYHRGTHCWANGSLENNVRYDSCENEGVPGEPLTESQVQNLIDLARWYVKEEGWEGFRRRIEAWEHREIHPTECPSDRIPWEIIIRAVEEADMVSQAEFDAFVKQTDAINRFQNEILVGQKKAIDLLAAIAVDHEKRIKALGG
jgi:hypothetical protein